MSILGHVLQFLQFHVLYRTVKQIFFQGIALKTQSDSWAIKTRNKSDINETKQQ